MKQQAPKPKMSKKPRRRAPAAADQMNQATTSDFEREDMGIAAKE